MTDDYVSRTNRNRLSRVPLSRRQLLTGLGGAALALSTTALTGCTITKGEPPISTLGLSKDPAKRPNGRPRAHNLSMYSLWGATVGQGLVAVAQEFEAANPDIGVGITFAPASGTVQQKLLTAVAGHEPPDIAQVVPLQTPQWAALGIMTDLTDWFERDGLSLDDYFAPAAEAMTYNDRVYSMNWDADPNFPLFWNKDLFEQSGLDPEKPPTTIEEVDEFNAKILKRDGGMATKVGLTPWDNYGFSNSIFTWGFAFGGRFRTPGTDDVTPDDEYVVKALEWICESAKKVGGPDAVSIATTEPRAALVLHRQPRDGTAGVLEPQGHRGRRTRPQVRFDTAPLWPARWVQAGAGRVDRWLVRRSSRHARRNPKRRGRSSSGGPPPTPVRPRAGRTSDSRCPTRSRRRWPWSRRTRSCRPTTTRS